MRSRLWIVGQYRKGNPPKVVWDFQGVFDSKEKAIRACRNSNYFIAAIKLNQEIPDEPMYFPDFEYPLEDK